MDETLTTESNGKTQHKAASGRKVRLWAGKQRGGITSSSTCFLVLTSGTPPEPIKCVTKVKKAAKKPKQTSLQRKLR
ncbi:hypothetical protein E2C01_024113 [Portunus trituberculatus]|uniref:Uncharacterized protein n=1 Tax=Portunus trituberculatus TaxID=210409 RepID=A0A5B7ECZ8_PORTR|nr:hypothetical protein [Portunus trituberculatus]